MVALAAGEDAAREVRAADDADWTPVAERLLLPLAANDEQEQIARKLARHSGVTVQGPPGTGKSHTIANLVSHLVAHGKRVLVTAHKDQALAVLRDKIPAELRDLSLAVLGSSSADLTELQRSVQAITAAADGVDERREEKAAAALRDRLDQVQGTWRCCASGCASRSNASRRAWRSAGSGAVRRRSPSGSPGTADDLDRIPDPLTTASACPLGAPELAELYSLAAGIGRRDAVAATMDLPPATARRRRHHRPVGRAAQARRDPRRSPGVRRRPQPRRRHRAGGAGRARRAVRAGRAHAGHAPGAVARTAARADRPEPAVACAVGRARGGSPRTPPNAPGSAPRSPGRRSSCRAPYRETLGLLEQARERFAQGKRVSPLVQRGLAQFLKAASLDGEAPRTAADIEKITAFVELRRRRETAARLWQDELVAALGAPVPPGGGGAVEIWIDAQVQKIHAALAWEGEHWPRLRSRLSQVLVAEAVPPRPVPDDLHRLATVLGGLRARARQRQVRAELDSLAYHLAEARGRATPVPCGTTSRPRWTAATQVPGTRRSRRRRG